MFALNRGLSYMTSRIFDTFAHFVSKFYALHAVWFIRNTSKFILVLLLNFSKNLTSSVAYLFLNFLRILYSLFLKNYVLYYKFHRVL